MVSDRGTAELGVGDCAPAGCAADWRYCGGGGCFLKTATGDAGALAGIVVALSLGGARVFFGGAVPSATAGMAGGCMPLVVVVIAGTGGTSSTASVGAELMVLAILERLLERLAGAGTGAGSGTLTCIASSGIGRSEVVRRRLVRDTSSGFSSSTDEDVRLDLSQPP
jgi:hypothetical protein